MYWKSDRTNKIVQKEYRKEYRVKLISNINFKIKEKINSHNQDDQDFEIFISEDYPLAKDQPQTN